MGDIVKNGYIKRYSKSILSGGWNKSFLELHRDSTLNVYKKQGDSKCQGSIFMKDVCKYFAYGEFTAGMPDRPDLPPGASYDCLMGIPQKPSSKAKIHWFLFSSTNELNEWMKAICSVLPPPPQKAPDIQPQSHHQPQVSSSAPPPVCGPPLGFENLTLGAAPPYSQAPYSVPFNPPTATPQQPYYPPATQVRHGPPPPQGYYPQQGYYPPNPGYPQQQYYQQPPGGYHQPQQGYGYQPQPVYQQQPVVYQQQPVVYQQHKKKGGILGSNTGKLVAGVAGGALLGYGASRMLGGGWGLGRWGSWSSLSSIGSFGSCGSFGSFGSFD